jgi:hypothetical protein
VFPRPRFRLQALGSPRSCLPHTGANLAVETEEPPPQVDLGRHLARRTALVASLTTSPKPSAQSSTHHNSEAAPMWGGKRSWRAHQQVAHTLRAAWIRRLLLFGLLLSTPMNHPSSSLVGACEKSFMENERVHRQWNTAPSGLSLLATVSLVVASVLVLTLSAASLPVLSRPDNALKSVCVVESLREDERDLASLLLGNGSCVATMSTMPGGARRNVHHPIMKSVVEQIARCAISHASRSTMPQ